MRATPIHPEGGRYAAPLLFLPGLWSRPRSFDLLAGYLAHRGWAGWLLDVGEVRGGVAARIDAVVAHAGTLASPPVLIGHDLGALIALAASRRRRDVAACLVMLAPLVPGETPVAGLLWRWNAIAALLLGRDVPPPSAAQASAIWGQRPPAGLLTPERADVVLDVARARVTAEPARVPALCVGGAADPLLPPAAARGFAARMGADHREVAAAAHFAHVGARWRTLADVVHRWLVTRLGEPLLETYADAMAERDADDDEPTKT